MVCILVNVNKKKHLKIKVPKGGFYSDAILIMYSLKDRLHFYLNKYISFDFGLNDLDIQPYFRFHLYTK